uniref:Kinesin motor domain-containing protein n=1 Tax=Macrostomum lignano TaxID=282301 RepID=A0A1I8HEH1_9PLAT
IPELQLTAEQLAAIAAESDLSQPTRSASNSELGQLSAANRPPLVTRLRAAAEERPNAEATSAALAGLLAEETAKLAANRALIERGLAASPAHLFRFGQSAGSEESIEAELELESDHDRLDECEGSGDRDGRAAASTLSAAAAGLLNRIPKLLDRSTSMRQTAATNVGSYNSAGVNVSAPSATIDPLTGRRWISEDSETPVPQHRLAKLKSGNKSGGRRSLTRSKSASEERSKSTDGTGSDRYQPSLRQRGPAGPESSQVTIRTSASLSAASNSTDGATGSDGRFLAAAAASWRPGSGGNDDTANDVDDNDSVEDFEEPGYAYIKDVLPQRQSNSTAAESDTDQPNEAANGPRSG